MNKNAIFLSILFCLPALGRSEIPNDTYEALFSHVDDEERLARHFKRFPTDARDEQTGETVLHLAALANATTGTRYILKQNVTVDIFSNAEETPLNLALQLENYVVAAILIVEGGAERLTVTESLESYAKSGRLFGTHSRGIKLSDFHSLAILVQVDHAEAVKIVGVLQDAPREQVYDTLNQQLSDPRVQAIIERHLGQKEQTFEQSQSEPFQNTKIPYPRPMHPVFGHWPAPIKPQVSALTVKPANPLPPAIYRPRSAANALRIFLRRIK